MRRVLLLWLAAGAAAQELEMRALLPRLGADDYREREAAERRLEALVREGGQAAFDVLESTILPDARAGSDAEIALRVEGIVRRLGTMRLLWRAHLAESLPWRPRIEVGKGVVVVSGSSGLHVLDAGTGSVRWSLPGTFQAPLPGIGEGIVYANRPPDAVAACRSTDGTPTWVHDVADLGGDSGRTRRVGVLRGNGVRTTEERPIPPGEWTDFHLQALHVPEWDRTIVATPRGNVAALDAKGRRIWTANVAGDTWAKTTFPRAAVELRLVLVGGWDGGPRLLALSAETGEVKWTVPVEGLDGISETISSGRILVTAEPVVEGRIDGRLHAFDAATGSSLWTFKPPLGSEKSGAQATETVHTETATIRRGFIPHPGDETRMSEAHVVARGEIVITAVPALMLGVRASDGKILWKAPSRGIRLSDVEKDGLVWGTSDRGEIVAVDPRDGSVARTIDLMKLEAAEDAPKLLVERGDRPPAEELGDLSAPVFEGDVCFLTTASGWTIALRIPPFRSRE